MRTSVSIGPRDLCKFAGIVCSLAAFGIGLSGPVHEVLLLALLLVIALPDFVMITTIFVVLILAIGRLVTTASTDPLFLSLVVVWGEAFLVTGYAYRGSLTHINLAGMRPALVGRMIRRLLQIVTVLCLAAALCRKFTLSTALCWAVIYFWLWWVASGAHGARLRFRRAWILNGALAAVSVAIALGLLEVATRTILHVGPPGSMAFEHDPDYVFRFKPGASMSVKIAVSKDERRPNVFHISSQGIRDREFGPKAPDEFRILVLGDSFAMGFAVAAEQSIPKHLERLFEGLSAKRITVVNAAMTGAGPIQELGILRTRGWGFEPDLVILQFCASNDIENCLEMEGKHLRAYPPDFHEFLGAMRNEVLLPYRIEQWLRGHSRAYWAVERAARQLGGGGLVVKLFRNCRLYPSLDQPPLPPPANSPYWMEVDLAEWYPELEEGMAILQDYVCRIRDECRERRVPLVAFCAPDVNDIDDVSWAALLRENNSGRAFERARGLRRIEAFLQAEGIPMLSLVDALKAWADPDALYYRYDGHFTELGNRVIAECIRDYLRAQHLVPD